MTARIPAAHVALALLVLGASPVAGATPVAIGTPDFDRWMYPFNGTPGTRNLASTFGSFVDADMDDALDFDNKDGQFFVAFDTASAGIPTGEGPGSYSVVSVKLTVTHEFGTFPFDPTYDAWQTYLDPGDPSFVADPDPGRPIELHGVGLRNGYTSLSLGPFSSGPPEFEEQDSFGASMGQGLRNMYPLGFGIPDAEGDVSNNVRHPTLAGFDTFPFAIGQATVTTAGMNVISAVPGTTPGETFEFDVDVSNPSVLAYVQDGLDAGLLAFSVVSMHDTNIFVTGSIPLFYTRDSTDPAAVPATLEVVYQLPEPGSAVMLAAGLLGLLALGRRRFRG